MSTGAYAVIARVSLLSTSDGGLLTAMPSGTRSLLLVFDSGTAEEALIGAAIKTTDGSDLSPGSQNVPVTLTFWAGTEAGGLAKPGVLFTISYGGREVGHGVVESS